MKDFEKVTEQYMPMISAIIRKLHIYRDYEAYRQVGKVALWQAFTRYEEDKGAFAPFAYRSMQGAMLDELKRESRFAGRYTVSENVNTEEAICDEDTDQLPEWLDGIHLKESELNLLNDLYVKGISLTKLAKIHGLSTSGMKKRRERVLKKVKEGMPFEIYKLYLPKRETRQ